MGEIYIVMNETNGMTYIGKTTKTILERRKDHKTKASRKVNNTRFHNAIRKYGIESFRWEVLEICEDSALNQREMHYIKLYNSNNKDVGYNMTDGGDNDPKCNLGRKLPDSHRQHISEAGKGRVFSKETRKSMSIAQKNRYANDGKLKEALANADLLYKEIDQYDSHGTFIKRWSSIKEAAGSIGVDSSNISRACSGATKSSAGFIWRYKGEQVLEEDVHKMHSKRFLTADHRNNISKGLWKKVDQYDLDGNFITTWDSINVAAEAVGIAKSGIIRCCKGEQKKSAGFIWKYKEV